MKKGNSQLSIYIIILFFSVLLLPIIPIDAHAAGRQYVVLSENSTADSANLIFGRDFNTQLKQLVTTTSNYEKQDSKITKIIFMSSGVNRTSKGTNIEDYLASRGVSIGYEAYAILEDNTIYIYTKANKFNFNAICWNMFFYLKSLTSIEFGDKVDSSSMTDADSLFEKCYSIKTIDVSKLNVSNVKSFNLMFQDCESLESLDLRTWNTSNSESFCGIFMFCTSMKSVQFGPGFNTSKVIYFHGMFQGCESLTSIDLSTFDTHNATDFEYMFLDCKNLQTIDLSSFNTLKATNMNTMFANCSSLVTLDLSSFDTSSVTNLGSMFAECTKLTNLAVDGFDTSSVDEMRGMFSDCISINALDLSGWVIRGDCLVDGMLTGCTKLVCLDAPRDVGEEVDLPHDYYLDDNKDGITDSPTKYTKLATALVSHRYILEKNISRLHIDQIPDHTYSGTSLTPEIVVKNGNITLQKDTDYTVSYSNNTNVGQATVTVQGMGHYISSTSINFTINPRSINEIDISMAEDTFTYDGQPKSPAVIVKYNSTDLVVGTDYTVEYSDNVNVGTGRVIVKGCGNFCSEKTLQCTIEKPIISIRAAQITLNESVFAYDGSEKKPRVTAVILNGITLTAGTDYTVGYSNNINIGTGIVTVYGIGDYCDSASCSFNIIQGSEHTYDDGETFVSDSFNYTITDADDHEVELISCNKKLKNVVIPAKVTVDGVQYTVISIGTKAFYKNTNMESLTVANSVKSIENYAFYGCTKLKTVKIGKGLDIVGSNSFRQCTKLETITFPKSIDEIGKNAFYGCKRLKKLNINANTVVDIDANAIKGTSKKLVINVPNKLVKKYKKKFTKKTGFKKTMKIV